MHARGDDGGSAARAAYQRVRARLEALTIELDDAERYAFTINGPVQLSCYNRHKHALQFLVVSSTASPSYKRVISKCNHQFMAHDLTFLELLLDILAVFYHDHSLFI